MLYMHGALGVVQVDYLRGQVAMPDDSRTDIAGMLEACASTGPGYAVDDQGRVIDCLDYVPLFNEAMAGWNVPAVLASSRFLDVARHGVRMALARSFMWRNGAWKAVPGEQEDRMIVAERNGKIIIRARAQAHGVHWECVVKDDAIVDPHRSYIMVEDRTGHMHRVPSGCGVANIKGVINAQ